MTTKNQIKRLKNCSFVKVMEVKGLKCYFDISVNLVTNWSVLKFPKIAQASPFNHDNKNSLNMYMYFFCCCLEFWPRLIVDEQKPAWLKVNFDRWQSEDTSDSEKEEQEQKAKLEVNIERVEGLVGWKMSKS